VTIASLEDMPIERLPEGAAETLCTGWLTSLDFCRGYCIPPAQRAALWRNADGQVRGGCLYAEERSGLFRRLRIWGPPACGAGDLRELMRARRAQLAVVERVDPRTADGLVASSKRARERPALEDHVIPLGRSMEDYRRSLGPRMARRLPNYVRRLRREWAGRHQEIRLEGPAIGEAEFRSLVGLNRARMARKDVVSMWDEERIALRLSLARRSGLLVGVTCDGALAAGTLSYLHAGEAYLAIVAHDPAHDPLHPGMVALWLTIERLIAMGCDRYHLLWGRSSYKTRLGGLEQPFHEVTIYSSRFVSGSAGIGRLLGRIARRVGWSA
jgi:hypothetical protein